MRQAHKLALPTQQDRLDRKRGEIWDKIVKLCPNLRRIGDVSNYETCEAGENLDCLSYVSASWD